MSGAERRRSPPTTNTIRVIAGTLKGRRLVTPRGPRTRPTADQVRIALLDTLMPWLPGARVLDLFAGAGGVGFEALSRGAAQATFIERDAQALTALRTNVETLGVHAQARLVRGDVERELGRLAAAGERFDVVFLDPPYEGRAGAAAGDLVTPTLARLGDATIAPDGAIVVAQHPTKHPPADAFGRLRAFRTRRFGETTLTFYRLEPRSPEGPEA